MNRRRLGIIAVAAVAAFSCITAVTSTIAWFRGDVSTKDELQGGMKGAYFAGGTGTSTDPYIILHPIHLYNLAWLQYLGYFNRDINGDGALDTFYFKLSDALPNGELDMTGYTLPPIGTERYPFIGNFNGNNKIIKELDVSNDFGDFSKHPSTVTATGTNAFVQPRIVGFFGVIGSLPNPAYTYSSANNKFYDAGLANVDVKTVTTSSLIGVVAGYVNGDISGVAVDASAANISAANTTSLSYTGNLSDYGVVGYVEKKEMKNQITRVEETIYDLNISKVHEFNANDQGDTQGFGGSIDMKKLYNDIVTNVWEECTGNTIGANGYANDKHVAQYSTAATKLIAEDGTEGQIVFDNNSLSPNTGNGGFIISGDESNYFPSGYDTNRRYYNYSIQDNSKDTSSFGLIVETENSNGISSEKRFMCLSGERDIKATNAATLTTSYYVSATGSFIYYADGSGTRNYLNDNLTNTPENVTVASTASLWTFSNGVISTVDLVNSTNTNTVRRYLNCTSANTLTITGTSSSTWTKDTNGYYVTISGTKYYLGFNGTNWTTTAYYNAAANETYYLIHSGTHYMQHDSLNGNRYMRTVENATSSDETVRWYYSNGSFYGTANLTFPITGYSSGYGNTYYVLFSSGNMGTALTFTAASGTLNDGSCTGYLTLGTRYAYYASGQTYPWRMNASENALTFERTHISHPAGFDTDIHSPSIAMSASTTHYSDQKSRTSTIDSYVHTFPTYMPLTNKKTTVGTTTTETFGVPDPYNTGYIVSGAKYRDDPYGDIRVSSYASSNISALTTSDGVISKVYTVNATGYRQTVADDYSDTYEASRTQLQTKVLKGSSNIYGLHFMDAAISSDQTVSAQTDPEYSTHQAHNVGHSAFVGRAVVNKETFDNYELPTDCIDFNLKEKGYINFFAGTYYPNNNSFFSLYEIVRDANQRIIQLREISEIYSDSQVPNSYQYKYASSFSLNGTSGQYSIPFKFVNSVKKTLDDGAYTEHNLQNSARSGYTSVFKTDWIKGVSANTGRGTASILSNAAYYFEIPMNDGEYALGSVSGKNGAYLMYLDIGANAAKVYRTVISERFKSDEAMMEYPLGIAILTSPSSITPEMKEGKKEHIELVCVEIAEKYTGTIRIARGRDANNANASTSQINVTGNSPGLAYPVFQGDGVELNIAAQLVPKSHTTKDIKRIQYYDYGVNTQETTRVVITFTSTNGGAYARDIKCYDANDEEITDQSKWKIFRTAGGRKFLQLSDITYSNLTSTTGDGLFYTEVGTDDKDILLKARYWEDVATGESAYVLTVSKTTDDNAKQTFVFKDYQLAVTATNGSLTVEVLKKGSMTVKIGNTTVTAVGQKIVINS